MGKQINYWLEYESFRQLAHKALDLGCEIVRENLGKNKRSMVTVSHELDMITDELGAYYYFHLPEAGNIEIKEYECGERLNRGFNECGNAVIEAGFSRVWEDDKRIVRERLYLQTGYYDKDENYIYRPDCIVKVYNALARCVKRLAPYTEITRTMVTRSGDRKDYKIKEYISPYCLELYEKGYTLN